jgi:hypothetical protein
MDSSRYAQVSNPRLEREPWDVWRATKTAPILAWHLQQSAHPVSDFPYGKHLPIPQNRDLDYPSGSRVQSVGRGENNLHKRGS